MIEKGTHTHTHTESSSHIERPEDKEEEQEKLLFLHRQGQQQHITQHQSTLELQRACTTTANRTQGMHVLGAKEALPACKGTAQTEQ